jgi:hypothetical protein
MQEEIEDRDTYEDLDETDDPTFLPQRPPIAHYNVFEGLLNKETNRVFTIAPGVPWRNAAELPKAFHGSVR